jgi:hypothetical protein
MFRGDWPRRYSLRRRACRSGSDVSRTRSTSPHTWLVVGTHRCRRQNVTCRVVDVQLVPLPLVTDVGSFRLPGELDQLCCSEIAGRPEFGTRSLRGHGRDHHQTRHRRGLEEVRNPGWGSTRFDETGAAPRWATTRRYSTEACGMPNSNRPPLPGGMTVVRSPPGRASPRGWPVDRSVPP